MSAVLDHAPTEHELARLYYELSLIGGSSVGKKNRWPYRCVTREDLLALAGDMLRYDARLLSILLQLVLARFRELNPLALRVQMQQMRCPQALLVVLDFCKQATTDAELRHFADYVCAGWSRVDPPERFFLDAERPGSRISQRKLGRNLAPYARWGFIGTERPIVDPKTKRAVGRYDAATRRRILGDLAATRADFTLADYLEAVDRAISRQQALADLHACASVRSAGHGRGAKWLRRRR